MGCALTHAPFAYCQKSVPGGVVLSIAARSMPVTPAAQTEALARQSRQTAPRMRFIRVTYRCHFALAVSNGAVKQNACDGRQAPAEASSNDGGVCAKVSLHFETGGDVQALSF